MVFDGGLPKMKLAHKTALIVFLFIFAVIFLKCKKKQTRNLTGEVPPYRFKYLYPKIKTVLLWNSENASKELGLDWGMIKMQDCEITNCVITDNKNQPFQELDAILFHNMTQDDRNKTSQFRNPKERYVYINQISPLYIDVFEEMDSFFNLTISYDMDSDIFWSYFIFKDSSTGDVVAPIKQPTWRTPDKRAQLDEFLSKILSGKKKKVAWFASDCHTKNDRLEYVKELKQYIDVDVYGRCGDKVCPKETEDQCFQLLSKEYYFYLAFENSNCADFVTEKVFNAMKHNVVPIVFGGANYTKFLPPESYINARTLHPETLAKLIEHYVNSPEEYEELFWWRAYYTIAPSNHPFCDLCKILNDESYPRKMYALSNLTGAQKSKCTSEFSQLS